MLLKNNFVVVFCVLISFYAYCVPSKFRLVGIGDLSTEMTLVFNTSDNEEWSRNHIDTKPKVYYSTSSSSVNNLTSTYVLPTSVNTNSQMLNNICRLSNLEPNTTYYFKVVDSIGSSEVYWFETLPNDDSPLSIIAGGDSRSNRNARIRANKMVAKLKPHAILFTGDFTKNGSPIVWQRWFEDWQYTIDASNRITPIIPTRGNCEGNDNFLIDLFGAPAYVYYTSSNSSLLTVITLNSEKAVNAYGVQTNWLLNSLSKINTTYKIAQYHKPMRPHVSTKLEGVAQYAYWAKIFEDYQVDLVVESDAHVSKTTWPVVVCTGGLNCDEGFRRDDENGVVYTGEGGWGAPIRTNNDDKIWTRSSGMFNQFKWIFIDAEKLELRTIKVDNEADVAEVNIKDRFKLPQGIDIHGEVSIINAPDDLPEIINQPKNNETFAEVQPIVLSTSIENSNKTVDQVSFHINGSLIATDNTAPYTYEDWFVPDYGIYTLTTITIFNTGETKIKNSNFQVIETNQFDVTKITTTTDDAEEYSNGSVDLFNWDMDLGYKGYTCGFRFQNVNIPPNAKVTNAYIQFTADETKANSTTLTIYGEKNANAKTFFFNSNDISCRAKTKNSVLWNVLPWTNVSAAGTDESTPDLSNILNEIIALDDYTLESPFVFIIEGSGYRVSETVDGDSINAPVLRYSYYIDDEPANEPIIEEEPTNELINIWPGDADNDGQVNAKDVLFICHSYNNEGAARLNANSNWVAQPVNGWNGSIAGVNLAHQDADGNGIIQLNDIDVVHQNYSKQTAAYTSYANPTTKVLKLQQASPSGKTTAYDVVLENYRVSAHGIHGKIDLSGFLKNDKDIVKIDSSFNAYLGADVLFTKYHKDTKTLDFAISETDRKNTEMSNISLLRIIIITDDLMEGGDTKKATVHSSGILCCEGTYERLKGSTFFAFKEQTPQTPETTSVNFSLTVAKTSCEQLGTAEVQIYNDVLYAYEYEWSNGSTGKKVDSLAVGNHSLTIKKEAVPIKTLHFQIESLNDIAVTIIVDEPFSKNTTIEAFKEISVNNGVEISDNYTIEFLIENCVPD